MCTRHLDCPFENYCSQKGLCFHCINCHDPYNPDEVPISFLGPSQCNCTSHEDCGQGGYCSIYHNQFSNVSPIPMCVTCRYCNVDYRLENSMPFDSDKECPDKCFCSSIADCQENEYGSTQGQRRQSVCVACNSEEGGCLDEWSVGDDLCKTVCAMSWECNTHEDCERDCWCAMNHRCRECDDGQCWTRARIEGVESLSSYQLPTTSIDLACPPSCCDWTNFAEFSLDTYFMIGRCDASIHINASWTKGMLPNWTVAKAKRSGTSCDAPLVI